MASARLKPQIQLGWAVYIYCQVRTHVGHRHTREESQCGCFRSQNSRNSRGRSAPRTVRPPTPTDLYRHSRRSVGHPPMLFGRRRPGLKFSCILEDILEPAVAWNKIRERALCDALFRGSPGFWKAKRRSGSISLMQCSQANVGLQCRSVLVRGTPCPFHEERYRWRHRAQGYRRGLCPPGRGFLYHDLRSDKLLETTFKLAR